jgi:RecB family endonuclease NucS
MTFDVSFVRSFITQAHDGNLKTSQYPRELGDLKMKVSFGMGMAARVPWISFTAPGMSTSNGYYPVYLYYKDSKSLILAYGISETSEFSSNWPLEIQEQNPKVDEVITNPARYGDSYVFKEYQVSVKDGIALLYRDSILLGDRELSEDLNSILNTYKKTLDLEVRNESSLVSSGLFYMEKQLEDFIIENWESTQLGTELELIYEEGNLKSQQYRTDIGPIDILARSKVSGEYVVIELKKNQSSDDTVGQILRYMGWVREKLKDERVRGVIVAGKYDEKLDYARKMIPGLEVFIYEVNFSLKEYKK